MWNRCAAFKQKQVNWLKKNLKQMRKIFPFKTEKRHPPEPKTHMRETAKLKWNYGPEIYTMETTFWYLLESCNDFLTSFADPGILPPASGGNSIWNSIQFKLYSLCLRLLEITYPGIAMEEINATRRKYSAPFLSCSIFIHSTDTACFCSTGALHWSDEEGKGSLLRILPPSSLTRTSGGSVWKSNCLSHLQAMLKLNKYQITSDMVLSLPPSIPSGVINNLYWLCRVIHH